MQGCAGRPGVDAVGVVEGVLDLRMQAVDYDVRHVRYYGDDGQEDIHIR